MSDPHAIEDAFMARLDNMSPSELEERLKAVEPAGLGNAMDPELVYALLDSPGPLESPHE